MLDINDILGDSANSTKDGETAAVEGTALFFEPRPLQKGGPEVRALINLWQKPGTILHAGPGCGKSTAIVTIVSHLLASIPEVKIVVATPTRQQAVALAESLYDTLPLGCVKFMVSEETGIRPEVLEENDPPKNVGAVEVRTVHSCMMNTPTGGFYIVDESFQVPYAYFVHGGSQLGNALLVGDPGQLPPVVNMDTSVFEKWGLNPHKGAPMVAMQLQEKSGKKDWTEFFMGDSYRLGETSCRVIQPLYDFPLNSIRKPTSVEGHEEIVVNLIPAVKDHNEGSLMAQVVDKVVSLIGTNITIDDETRELQASDIAVVLSRNTQVTHIRALLDSHNLGPVTVGTADSLQGSEYPVVVCIDPLTGMSTLNERDGSSGLTCVMLSRHRSLLVWFMEENWAERVALIENKKDAEKAQAVRDNLMGL